VGYIDIITSLLLTADNVPPPGYLYNPCGYEGAEPVYKVE